MGSSPLTRGKRRPCWARRPRPGLIPAHAGKTPCGLVEARTSAAHPRSRGENWRTGALTVWLWGSSPLTRGKPARPVVGASGWGLIPAHAGKTAFATRWSRASVAHPRSRGENMMQVKGDNGIEGSSPLTRGKLPVSGAWGRTGGLIPAHAGKTHHRSSASTESEAHPRSRGENRSRRSRARSALGSSPLTRGKQDELRAALLRLGLIPAHAGKTASGRSPRIPRGAHPRSRGENTASSRQSSFVAGSSPLTRGKPGSSRGPSSCPGLIPAHAGKTSGGRVTQITHDGSSPLTRGKPGSAARSGRDGGLIPAHAGKTRDTDDVSDVQRAHPRSRGENESGNAIDYQAIGSSPLTRGKPSGARVGTTRPRLIPAHAGKTSRCAATRRRGRAHPRSRGENLTCAPSNEGTAGSSPLTRGKLVGVGSSAGDRGLIPAHAGKTLIGASGSPIMRAHPRSRGENHWPTRTAIYTGGSSPLTRGKHGRVSCEGCREGLIPAHAGKTGAT